MTQLEQLLRDAMTTHTDDLPELRPGAARLAVRHSRRAARARVATLSTATAAVTGVGVWGVSALHAPTTPVAVGASLTAVGTTPPAAHTAKPAAKRPTVAIRPKVAGPKTPGPADLAGVSLPDPAPGFPLRRAAEQVEYGSWDAPGLQWAKTFELGVSAPIVHQLKGGDRLTLPTGPEATVDVIDGAVAPDPADPVVATPTVAGHPGRVVTEDGGKILYFKAGQLTVQIYGTAAVTDDQLVALGEALQGLPG